MSKNTYRATLNYYDSSWGWKNEGTASQGQWDGTGVRTGVMYFAGLSALKGKIINSVTLTVSTGETGYGLATTKTAYIYNSAAQGGIHTSLNANHKTGSAIGSVKAPMWGNTNTFTVSFMASPIASGHDTYCIYNGSSYNDYLKWTSVSITVDWSEPATQPSLSSSSVYMGSSVTITTTATNSAYRHTLKYTFGSASGTIATGVAGSYSWTPSLDLARQIPSTTVGYGTIYCETYSGSTYLGTKSVSIALYVPSSVKPSDGTLSAAINSDTSGTGRYVKGMCKAKITLSGASGSYGSSISSYTITGGGYNVNSASLTTDTLTTSGTITFTASVTDSRGRISNSVTCSITVLDYTKPSVSSCKVYRCNSNGNAANSGTSFAIECTANYSSGIPGNTVTISAKYKKSSDSSYGAAISLTNGSKKVVNANLSTSSTYDVQITVHDKYNSITLNYTLPTKSTLLSFIKNAGAAIGKVAELKGWLDIQWNTRIRNNLHVDGGIANGGATNQSVIDLLNIDVGNPYGTSNYDCSFGTDDASTLINSPVTSGPFYAYRRTYLVYNNVNNFYNTTIELHESYPQRGRIWKREYAPNIGWSRNWSYSFTNNDVVPISNGGTGATSRAEALLALQAGGSGLTDANIVTPGVYVMESSTCRNAPPEGGYYILCVMRYHHDDSACIQLALHLGENMLYHRLYVVGQWREWRLEGDMDSGWQNASITGSFALYGSDSVLRYRKIGRIVQVEGTLRPSTTLSGSATNLTIFTLPEGYRPSAAVVTLCQGSGSCHWALTIKTNGDVCFARYSSGGSYASADTGTWLPFHHTFMV